MKSVLLLFALLMFLVYAMTFLSRKEILQVLQSARFEIEENSLHIRDLFSQTRIFLFLLLFINLLLWLSCFTVVNHRIGAIGAGLSFVDFVTNHELLGYLCNNTFTEQGAKKVLWGFQILYALHMGTLGMMIWYTLQ